MTRGDPYSSRELVFALCILLEIKMDLHPIFMDNIVSFQS